MISLLLAYTGFLGCTDGTGGDEGDDPETCFDGEDNDADGEIDCDDAGCSDVEGCLSSTGDIVINEFMAANGTTIETPEGAYSDWIELYNAGEESVDIGDWTITDDLGVPGKHILQSQTIEPGGFLLLWADDDEEELGAGHLGWHLDVEGESIGLYRPDGSASDTVEYDAQAEDLSAARIPDGSNDWVITDDPTPGESNGE
ncbi:MAG: lamin tail domain-containing protein [Proteobacteria bacterium]|nr:lamin tail domain-containing protein [Pseudomonadota bacterium]MCP4917784.1 lamin tail domain-containing protein [Pseudomonadota bacterium]